MHIGELRLSGYKRLNKAIADRKLPEHFFSNLKTLAAESPSANAKNSTERRRQALKSADSKSLMRFTIAYPPSQWESGRTMSDRDFERLLDTPKRRQDLDMELQLSRTKFCLIILRELEVSGVSMFQRLRNVKNALEQYEDDEAANQETAHPDEQVQAELQGNSKHHEQGQWRDLSVGITQTQMQSEYSALLGSGKHAHFPGAQKSKVAIISDLLLEGLQTSRTWKEEAGPHTNTVQVFVPLDSKRDDGILRLTVSSSVTWTIMEQLGLLSE